jgi:hypothetical protein
VISSFWVFQLQFYIHFSSSLPTLVSYNLLCYFYSEIRKLDQDHRRLERSCEAAEMLGTSLQEAHGCLHRMLKRTEEQLKKYESEVVALRGLFLEFT